MNIAGMGPLEMYVTFHLSTGPVPPPHLNFLFIVIYSY